MPNWPTRSQSIPIVSGAIGHLIIIGGGPAGLVAATFAARDGFDTLVIEREQVGGNANLSGEVENMPGFPTAISGFELSDRLRAQARKANVEMIQAANVVRIDSLGPYHTVVTEDGEEYSCFALIIATGSTYRRLQIPGESKLNGSGVYYCAATDAYFYTGEHVAVVGGGNSAAEAALALASYAGKVSMLVRGENLTANAIIAERLLEIANIEVIYGVDLHEFRGDGQLEAVCVRDMQTDQLRDIAVRAAFVFIGMRPNSEFLRESRVELDRRGFICTGSDVSSRGDLGADPDELADFATAVAPGIFESSVLGIFAAGDIRKNSSKFVATATGEGAAVAMLASQYLRNMA